MGPAADRPGHEDRTVSGARLRAAVAAVVLLGSVVAACGPEGGDPVDSDEATGRLERQREDVRAAMAELQRRTADALTGTVTRSVGQWRGCESAADEEYASFRYLADARVDVPSSTPRPYLDLLAPALEAAGFADAEAGERPGGRTLRATGAAGTAATVSELPGLGDHVLLTVAGPCVDVPPDDRAGWLTREDPAPEIR